MGFIFGIILVAGMCYVIYQHFATPFRAISQAKKIKQEEKMVKTITEDEVFKKRLKSLGKSLEENKITKEEFEEMFAELLKERKEELFNNSNSENDN